MVGDREVFGGESGVMVMSRCLNFFAALALALAAFASSAFAQNYPTRSISLIVPYPPGGGVDAMARIVAEKLSHGLGQQVVVDNRGGGGGLIGTRAVQRAAPDGYTLLLGHTGTISINPSLYANSGFDPRKDFAAIGLIASMPVVLIAHPSFPAKSVADFIALAKKDAGKLNIGTSAVGTGGYMAAELFKSMSGVNANLIPYKGTAPVMNDLLGGHVPVAFGVIPPALGNLQSGALRAIAVASPKRTSLLPDVPTFAEWGLPDFEAVLHYGLLAPAGTPKPIIERLNAELQKLASDEEVKKRIYLEGGDPLTSSAAEYAADIDKEETKWSTLIKKLNLKVE
jgi:tripartite-type tricarboxylate transporter receptor subunit TctC